MRKSMSGYLYRDLCNYKKNVSSNLISLITIFVSICLFSMDLFIDVKQVMLASFLSLFYLTFIQIFFDEDMMMNIEIILAVTESIEEIVRAKVISTYTIFIPQLVLTIIFIAIVFRGSLGYEDIFSCGYLLILMYIFSIFFSFSCGKIAMIYLKKCKWIIMIFQVISLLLFYVILNFEIVILSISIAGVLIILYGMSMIYKNYSKEEIIKRSLKL